MALFTWLIIYLVIIIFLVGKSSKSKKELEERARQEAERFMPKKTPAQKPAAKTVQKKKVDLPAKAKGNTNNDLPQTQSTPIPCQTENTNHILSDVENLMVKGPDTSLSFERDFLAEGMDILNQYY